MKKLYRTLAVVALLGSLQAPLQALSWSEAKRRARAAAQRGFERTRSAAQAGYRRTRRFGAQVGAKAKDLWEDPRVRAAAGVAAAAAAAALGAYLLNRQNNELNNLEASVSDQPDPAEQQKVYDEVSGFAKKFKRAMQNNTVNADLLGLRIDNLTDSNLRAAGDQLKDMIKRYKGLLESKVLKVTQNQNMASNARQYMQVLSKLDNDWTYEYMEILLKELAHDILGVSRGASRSEIIKGYRKMSLQWHPDHASRRGISKDDAEDKFKLINAAFQLLKQLN